MSFQVTEFAWYGIDAQSVNSDTPGRCRFMDGMIQLL